MKRGEYGGWEMSEDEMLLFSRLLDAKWVLMRAGDAPDVVEALVNVREVERIAVRICEAQVSE